MVRPRLKSVAWERDGDEVRVVYDLRDQFLLADPDGTVSTLLELLTEGGRTPAQLAAAITERGAPVPVRDVVDAVDLLDSHGLVEDEDRLGRFDAESSERYFSNLAFFEPFASMARSHEDFQQTLRESHVLVLGTGGLNSNTIPHLCGLGVGRLTLLDRDKVDTRNLARQYLYRFADIGAPKVELAADWVRAFDPSIGVKAVHGEVTSRRDVVDLIDQFAPDAVMSGVDSPIEVDEWVNAGCVSRGVPFVRGGMTVTMGSVWSVDPGKSACRACAYELNEMPADEQAAFRMYTGKPRINRGIGPIAGLLGALCAFEILRFLTRFEPPAYAGKPMTLDFAAGCATRQDEWQRSASCAVCGESTDR